MFEYSKEIIRTVNRRTENTVTKRKITNEQDMIYKTLRRKLNNEQHELH